MKIESFYRVFLRSLVVLVVFAAASSGQSKRDRGQAKNIHEQADRAFQQKNYREAADKYGQAIVLMPNNPVLHYKKGHAHINLKENDPAISEFTIALSQGFKPLEIYRVRAFIYFEQKNYDAALVDIRKGMALAPKDLLFLSGIGEINLARNQFPEALDAFQRAAQAAPNNADIRYNMARVYLAMGDAKGQAAAAGLALIQGTRFPGEAHFLLGDALQKQKNASGAIDAYQKAINSKPDLYQAYRNLAEIFRSENRITDAINVSKQGLKAFPNDGNLFTDVSRYYSLADRPDDAVQAAKAGVTLLPSQYAAYTNLCRAYNEKKDFAQAIIACNNALRIKPGDGETYFYLGRALNLSGKTVEATRYYGRAVNGLLDYTSKNPDNADGWYLLGNAYFADHQRDKALDAYLQCLSLSPKFPKAKYNLGIIYTRKKNKPAASDQYNSLIPLDARLAAQLKAEIDKM